MLKLDTLKKAAVAVAIVAAGAFAMPVMAAPVDCQGAQDCLTQGANETDLGGGGELQDIVGTIINVVLYVVGILAVGFIIYGGVKYATSAGDATKVTSAKNTIMYAVIGLIVAILAYAIVNFVVGSFGN